MKNKWDWNKLKAEFLVSEYDDVKTFLIQSWINYKSINWKYYKGRWREKEEFKARIYKKHLEELAQQKAKQIDLDPDDLKLLENWVIQVCKQKLRRHNKWQKVDTRLKEIWDIVREWLGKKDNKEQENFEPFKIFNIVNVWKPKGTDS